MPSSARKIRCAAATVVGIGRISVQGANIGRCGG
jgi:hypothetical protein